MDNRIFQYEPLWGSWRIDKLYMKSNYGDVYKISCKNNGEIKYAFAKIISIPTQEDLKKAVLLTGTSNNNLLEDYFKNKLQSVIEQIKKLNLLKDNKNILTFENYQVIKRTDSIGWDIILKMKYYQPLKEYLKTNKLNAIDIANLGWDIGDALEKCRINSIFHKNICEENIFIAPNNRFILGNFSISDSNHVNLENIQNTSNIYTAPEIFEGATFDNTCDIYSLGITMYKIANQNKYTSSLEHLENIATKDNILAQQKIIAEETLCNFTDIPENLAKIIQKACAFRKSERYGTPYEMVFDLDYAIRYLLSEHNPDSIEINEFTINNGFSRISSEDDINPYSFQIQENINTTNTIFGKTASLKHDNPINLNINTNNRFDNKENLSIKPNSFNIIKIFDIISLFSTKSFKKDLIIFSSIVTLVVLIFSIIVFGNMKDMQHNDSNPPSSYVEQKNNKTDVIDENNRKKSDSKNANMSPSIDNSSKGTEQITNISPEENASSANTPNDTEIDRQQQNGYVNLLKNPNFEENSNNPQIIPGWTTKGNMLADNVTAYNPFEGGFCALHSFGGTYEVYTYQEVKNLEPGLYTLKAFVKSSGGQFSTYMQAEPFNQKPIKCPIPVTQEWKEITIDNIEVDNGACIVGFYSYSSLQYWLYFDNVIFYKN